MVEMETYAIGIINLSKLVGQPGGIEFKYSTSDFPNLHGKLVTLGSKGHNITYDDIKTFVKATIYPTYDNIHYDFIPEYICDDGNYVMWNC